LGWFVNFFNQRCHYFLNIGKLLFDHNEFLILNRILYLLLICHGLLINSILQILYNSIWCWIRISLFILWFNWTTLNTFFIYPSFFVFICIINEFFWWFSFFFHCVCNLTGRVFLMFSYEILQLYFFGTKLFFIVLLKTFNYIVQKYFINLFLFWLNILLRGGSNIFFFIFVSRIIIHVFTNVEYFIFFQFLIKN